MIKIIDKVNCCGCGACEQSCPLNCIHMISDQEGFFYPEVDFAVCVNCGLCEQSCPISNTIMTEKLSDSYVAYNKDQGIRMASSSGGIFSPLCESVLEAGGFVFGVSFDEDFFAIHRRVDVKEELSSIRGSKYLQSRLNNTYIEIKKLLDKGEKVLFSGTGCQVAGLKTFLKDDYSNLLTVDVICHGVPSPKLWQRFIKEKEKTFGSKLKEVSFRKKITGWKSYSIYMEFESSEVYSQLFTKDSYMQMFLKDICLRPSCHKCRFKAINSRADITLGDCWGIERNMPDLDDDKGCSLIIVHTINGANLLLNIKHQLIIKKIDLSKVSQPMISESVLAHPNRRKYFAALERGESIQELTKYMKLTIPERIINKIKRYVR